MNIPKLKAVSRSREFKQYTFEEIARIVDRWLFTTDRGHRQLDRDILGIDPDYSKGWQSMGVLHFLGLKKEFHGIFKDYERSEVIKELKKDNQDRSSRQFNRIKGFIILIGRAKYR